MTPTARAASSTTETEFRCPVGRGGILLKLLRDGDARISDGNLIEVACRKCRDDQRREGHAEVLMVLHRFAMDGEHVETVTV